MKPIALIDGQVADLSQKTMTQMNLLVSSTKILGMGYLPEEDQDRSEIINIPHHPVIPWITDMSVILPNPYSEIHDSIETLCQTALSAGVTRLVCQIEEPILDTPESVNSVYQEIRKKAKLPFYLVGTMTQRRDGKILSEMALMKEQGIVACSDNLFIADADVFKKALQYSAMLDLPLLIGAVPLDGYDMTEGYWSTVLGLKGMSASLEASAIYRDLSLVKTYGGRVHFSCITTAESVNLIRQAKQAGLSVTCGTSPYYLYFRDKDLDGYNTHLKVNPPFRTEADQKALIEGLKDHTIDVLSSGHLPLPIDFKRTDFHDACPGISNLDLFLPSVLTKLHHDEKMPIIDIIEKITVNPAKILNLPMSPIYLGESPNLTILDLGQEKLITEDVLSSRCKNTPFINHTLKGFSVKTLILNP